MWTREWSVRPPEMDRDTDNDSKKWTAMIYCKVSGGTQMEPKRKNSCFSLYEVAVLRENPYTHKVGQKQISFTAEFKEIFWLRYQAGEYIPGIFESLGYDPNMLGIGRMYSLAANLRKCAAAGRAFTSGYTRHSPKGTKAAGKMEPDTTAMQHELIYLRQQVEFLKKITELGSGTKRRR